MKTSNIIKIAALVLLAGSALSCKDAKKQEIDNLVYISEASTGKVKEVILADSGESVASFTVRLAKAYDKDIKVKLTINPEILDAYNKKNETSFKLVDASNYEFESNATIEAGAVNAEPCKIKVKEFAMNGGQYALPVSITSVEGGIQLAEASRNIILILTKPLVQAAPTMTYVNAMKCAPADPWRLELNSYTIECWCKMSSFPINNQAIIMSGANENEIYIRFGDVLYANSSGRYIYNWLQAKMHGSQYDTGNPANGGIDFQGETWYHLAFTFNGQTGEHTMYVNGNVASTLTTAATKVWIDQFAMIGSNPQYFKAEATFAQVRMWKTCRTQNQIKKNMYAEVEYTNPDLELYIPMNEGEGDTLHDVTGHGHDMVIGNNGGSSNVCVWKQGYKFSAQ